MIRFETSLGSFTIELFDKEAPLSAQNFRDYVVAGFFDGTIFHRVIPGFVIQGGGFTADMQQKKTRAPIRNEADNGVKNRRGTLSMARTNDPHSATSQFFVNLVDNAFLDPGRGGAGYAVFGCVTEGMSVIDAIAASKTGRSGGSRRRAGRAGRGCARERGRPDSLSRARPAHTCRSGDASLAYRLLRGAVVLFLAWLAAMAAARGCDALGRPTDHRLHAAGSLRRVCDRRARLRVSAGVA